MKITSWKTTVSGLLSAVGLSLSASTNPTVHIIGVVAAGVGSVLMGWSAKDYNVVGGGSKPINSDKNSNSN